MEKRHFEMIAEAIRDAGRDALISAKHGLPCEPALKLAADYIADGCKADNPRFDRSRFLRACGFDA